MKERNVVIKNVLSVIKGAIQMEEKKQMVDTLSDDKVIGILKQNVKSLKEMSEIHNDEESGIQLSFIQQYLPKEMTEDEIRNRIIGFVNLKQCNIGDIMKLFSDMPVDRKLVSTIAKDYV